MRGSFSSPSSRRCALRRRRAKAGAGIIIYPVLSDRTEEFEALLETVVTPCSKAKIVRRQEARA